MGFSKPDNARRRLAAALAGRGFSQPSGALAPLSMGPGGVAPQGRSRPFPRGLDVTGGGVPGEAPRAVYGPFRRRRY